MPFFKYVAVVILENKGKSMKLCSKILEFKNSNFSQIDEFEGISAEESILLKYNQWLSLKNYINSISLTNNDSFSKDILHECKKYKLSNYQTQYVKEYINIVREYMKHFDINKSKAINEIKKKTISEIIIQMVNNSYTFENKAICYIVKY